MLHKRFLWVLSLLTLVILATSAMAAAELGYAQLLPRVYEFFATGPREVFRTHTHVYYKSEGAAYAIGLVAIVPVLLEAASFVFFSIAFGRWALRPVTMQIRSGKQPSRLLLIPYALGIYASNALLLFFIKLAPWYYLNSFGIDAWLFPMSDIQDWGGMGMFSYVPFCGLAILFALLIVHGYAWDIAKGDAKALRFR